VERLTQVRPGTLGQAARIPGVTPAAVGIVAMHIHKMGNGSSGIRDVQARQTPVSIDPKSQSRDDNCPDRLGSCRPAISGTA